MLRVQWRSVSCVHTAQSAVPTSGPRGRPTSAPCSKRRSTTCNRQTHHMRVTCSGILITSILHLTTIQLSRHCLLLECQLQ